MRTKQHPDLIEEVLSLFITSAITWRITINAVNEIKIKYPVD